MALISCPECNTQVSDRAETCVSCGFPIHDKKLNSNIFKFKKEGYKSILKVFGLIIISAFIALIATKISNMALMFSTGPMFTNLQIGYFHLMMYIILAFPLFHYRKIDTKKIKRQSWATYFLFFIILNVMLDSLFL